MKMRNHRGNGKQATDDSIQAERSRRMKEAVRDLPDHGHKKLTREDVDTLRRADLDDLAKIAERYVEA